MISIPSKLISKILIQIHIKHQAISLLLQELPVYKYKNKQTNKIGTFLSYTSRFHLLSFDYSITGLFFPLFKLTKSLLPRPHIL